MERSPRVTVKPARKHAAREAERAAREARRAARS
jgi:hypothetical protein